MDADTRRRAVTPPPRPHSSKTDPFELPDVISLPDIRERLTAEGVYPHLAAQWLRDHGPEACRNALERLDDQRGHGPIAQPGAWLAWAIRREAEQFADNA